MKMYITLILILSLMYQSSSEETIIQSLSSSTKTLLQNIDSCLGEEYNATSACQSDRRYTTPKANIQRVITDAHAQNDRINITNDDNIDIGNHKIIASKGKILLDNPTKEMESIQIHPEKDNESTEKTVINISKPSKVFEGSGAKRYTEEDVKKNLPEMIVDKRTKNASPTEKNNKYEKFNELILHHLAEKTAFTPSGGDNYKENLVFSTDEPITETPEVTTDCVTEVTGRSNGNVEVPQLVVKNDETTSRTHKSTVIPKNVIRTVAVQDCPCDSIVSIARSVILLE